VQQQRAAGIALGVALLLIVDARLTRRMVGRAEVPLGPRLAAFAGGVLLVVVPLAILIVARAGVGPAVEALVRFPLVNYRNRNHVG
jgi:hypothetical protein